MRCPSEIFESEVARWLSAGGTVESLCGNRRYRSGVLNPQCVADVQRIVYAASRARGTVKLQPVSCGKNWGFGSDLAAVDGAYTLNLSALKGIRSLDLKSHCAELEPGVTQGRLDDALRLEGSSHYFNVTGAGLEASVVGNALERGIGYSGQRHLDLLDVEVVLPSGEVARTSRIEASSGSGAPLGGLGPDPMGLFCQSNFGVVTAATIALYRRPEAMGGVLCHLADLGCFSDLITVVSDLIAEGSCYGVPHIFNRERIVTTLCPHLGEAQAAELRSSAAPWTALIPIRGSRAVFEASAQYLEARLKELGRVEILGDETKVKLSRLILGHPSDLTLASVAFTIFGRSAPANATLEASGAGLIHITPVMALRGDTICDVEERTMETLRRHGYNAVPLSLNALSARTAALIVSLGFDRRCPRKTEAAHHAAEDLLECYLQAGLLPYRLGLGQGAQLPQMQHPWPRIFSGMQRIFDPGGCMAPSRYEPLWRRETAIGTSPKPTEAELCIS
jgi:4-cresol dehydrogenase (hydroxylating) flavoprotein subunit